MSPSAKSGTGFVPSIFDRLNDDNPTLTSEVYVSPFEQRRRFRQSVYRDLKAVLNYGLFDSRRDVAEIPAELKRTRMSVLPYGAPGFTFFDVTNEEDQKNIGRAIGTAVDLFEPRLISVSVHRPSFDTASRQLHCRLEAWLQVGPETESVAFRVSLRQDSRRFEVTGED